MTIRNLIWLVAVGLLAGIVSNADASTILGTGSAALLGGDLTDQDDVHVEALPPSANGFDAEFFASDEPGFGGGEFAYNVFDNAVGGGNAKWCCGGPVGFPEIVGADFSTTLALGDDLIRLDRFTLTSSNDSPQRDPQDWELQGSTDTTTGLDGTWTTIFDHPSGNDWSARNQVIAYGAVDGDAFLTTDGFKAFRLRTDATGATGGAFFALNEIELFGEVFTPQLIPEPATFGMALLGLACCGSVCWRRRKRA